VAIRVLIADDQDLVRTGFRLILAGEPDIDVVGEADSGETVLRQAIELRPDVVLMDIRMPGLTGIEATRLLARQPTERPIRVVVVTTYDTDENVYLALRAGAVGFLLKDSGPALLVHAVRTAYTGDGLITPSVLTRLLQHWSGPASGDPGDPGDPGDAGRPGGPGGSRRPAEALTPRELDIARAVARGRTNAELAKELAIAVSTVKTHLTGIQRKVGARNRTEIAIWAWENHQVR
jgi:DNA-binding NarL/FixJ family response regulator